jgi:hypothetical protein
MSVRTNARSGDWLPCPGRIVTCWREGCWEAAADDMIQLCAIHLTNYEHDASRVLALVSKAKIPIFFGS